MCVGWQTVQCTDKRVKPISFLAWSLNVIGDFLVSGWKHSHCFRARRMVSIIHSCSICLGRSRSND